MNRTGRLLTQQVVTIANGASQSGALDISDYVLAAIVMPSAWTAASITFLASPTQNGTFLPVYDDAGTEVAIASAAAGTDTVIVNRAILEQLAGLGWIKLRSGTAGTPVNQGAARTLTVLLKS